MRIERITLYRIRLPLVHPFETSFGRMTDKTAILVRVDAEGLTGWGEAAVNEHPYYNEEDVVTAWHILRDYLVPAFVGRNLPDPEEAWRWMARVRGHHLAKAGLEMALWDLRAKAQGIPLARILGGVRDQVPVGVSIGIQEDVEALLDRIEAFVAQGYRRVKVKIRPGWDVEVLEAIRARFPDLPLMADANAAYRLEEADRLRALDPLNLMMIEQPLAHDDLWEHRQLQARLKTPICLDESIRTPEQGRAALEMGACRIINLKPGRVGGAWETMRLERIAREMGAPLWCGGMLETGVGRAHNVALASLPGFTLPGDLSGSDRYWHEDLVEPPFTVSPEGTLAVPQGPGIGVEVVEARVRRAAEAVWSQEAP